MTVLVLDSGGLSRLSEQKQENVALIAVLSRDGYWPPVVPSVVLAESISGRQHTDANTNRLLKRCDIVTDFPERLARRAGALRSAAKRGSAVDAVVVAMAEPDGVVFSSDVGDLGALAVHARNVQVHRA
ncbi:hypothetical protein [Candidatus Poriferisodalis sp.]|uniref:hypothetical protein n=1 Tax=Candidatus Poriferisodalis sp. TaxID=3101277 RepID=UPI003D14209B